MPAIPTLPRSVPTHDILDSTTSPTLDLLARMDSIPFSPPPNNLEPHLQPRQDADIVAIPTVYDTRGPPPGTVVAIVLGSIGGFVLLIFLLFHVGNISARSSVVAEEHIVRADRSPRSHRSRRSRHSGRTTEVRELSRSPRRGRVVVEERRERRGSMPPPPPGPPPMRIVEERIERERRVDGDDVVEVVEDYSDVTPPRRHRSRRGSDYRSVDPYGYGDIETSIRKSRPKIRDRDTTHPGLAKTYCRSLDHLTFSVHGLCGFFGDFGPIAERSIP
ncbi:hypothetical protein P152DRAFT_111568 [Eremomyces bilateralis CBS 781.70]|uniref:Uncharacterized protein n=1 Tax=Eremomyces bilateralis CBS 781.70 TaxID=1392243 RepID=A0A6G1GDL6_9PEZI|nr:uncharacterized protein P152DRAFT_111568 [Eremomyces bilateralis CBS 781.70]KAF1816133.1 hypothetical protein P152DRAFT_111568 [Eremomyces bilateralis CBS 781.70]